MSNNDDLRRAARQEQFLDVIDRTEAAARFHAHLRLEPSGCETVPLGDALGRVLARTVKAPVDAPGFDRASVDGFAVQSGDTYGASDETPAVLSLNPEVLAPGVEPGLAVAAGSATAIATGGMLPRGADAVVMIEHTDLLEDRQPLRVEIRKPALPGQFIAFAGTDIAKGETVMRAGQWLTSRELGVLAAIGLDRVEVYRRPRVAVISTGNEIVPPGEPLRPGKVYDSNGTILAAAVRELGGEPVGLGVVPDDETALAGALEQALACDMVLLSGGTSKGAGDLSYRAVSALQNPGVVAHGVALKPGKPICLAVTDGKPVVVLPGFPTSAIFNFHEFVAPVLRRMAGLSSARTRTVDATLPVRVASERGRTEYLLVSLMPTDEGLAAYPMGKGSGAVTAFNFADGFIAIDQRTEQVPAGSAVSVQLLGQALEPAELVFMGSQCAGLDYLLTLLQQQALSVKALYVGSMGGAAAVKRGECDIAGVHLMDPATGEYNRHLLTPELELVPGYRRMQGIVFRKNDARFEGKTLEAALATARADAGCLMINRNSGSGTRILIDRLLGGEKPPGYAVQPKSHNAVAAAVAQGRADWGVAIETVAAQYGLGFIPVQDGHYDFLVPKSRLERPGVRRFRELLADERVRQALGDMGFHT
ncbi:molybdenum cofactor synthesis protein [Methylocaldum marinum]|uniref:Molybdopterin molybdenumtransferase n=1 Tax=Methylocaldum marinum TaxID=1432792 RepID=A0A250KTN2_9GAMM|nr:molybdopterin biosynthesis protein [Methylocaldum marinum]BBA35010.1 molybdenum cofactor synthesis protein [Methylocaldum marinum]